MVFRCQPAPLRNGTNTTTAVATAPAPAPGGAPAPAPGQNGTAANGTAVCVPAIAVAEGGRVSFQLVGDDAETDRDSLEFNITRAPRHGAHALVAVSPEPGSGNPPLGTVTYQPR